MCIHFKLVGRDPPSLTEEGTEAAGTTEWSFLLYLAGESEPEGGRGDLAE